ncbi:MAG: carbon-nitrogen hydrolase family protein [Clostridia bacterium]|nr:carbon-nitrogen hydrolase family protein [Clostridia bacterium]
MKISVLQQGKRYYYDMVREKPELDLLKEMSARTLDDCFELLDQAGKEGADLAVTIENVNSIVGFGDTRFRYPEVYEGLDGPLVKRFSETAKKYNMYIVAGLLLTLEGKTYNTATLFGRDGKIIGIHKKVHLPAGEELNVTPGDRFEVFETDIGNIGMLVCWDLQFPEAARELALGGADLIACPTWGWENIYGLSRAYENSVTIAAAMGMHPNGVISFCDPSCVVDNMGNIVALAPRDKACVVTADIDIKKEPAPQYGSTYFYPSHSMRKTRFSQRRPDTYRLANLSNEETPLYNRYFEKKEEK